MRIEFVFVEVIFGNSYFPGLEELLNIWYIKTNMRAELVYHEKRYLIDGSFQEIKIWKVPESKDKPQGLKYSFAYVVNNQRVIGYDNYEHKGDHRHFKDKEYPYDFQGLERLWQDFNKDIERFREGRL